MKRLIRERTEARARLEARETRYRGVLESLKEVVFPLDGKGRWQYLNCAWTELSRLLQRVLASAPALPN
jgi:hypothetical protein